LAASNDRVYDPWSPRDRALRVGDKERDAVVEILRTRHLEGRLDAGEFQTRIDRSLVARTYAELDALLADFPHDEPRRTRQRSRGPWPPVFPFLPLALIAAIVFGVHVAWLVIPLLLVYVFFVRPLRWHAGGGYAGGPWARGPRRRPRI
jgi:hypothetical protein